MEPEERNRQVRELREAYDDACEELYFAQERIRDIIDELRDLGAQP